MKGRVIVEGLLVCVCLVGTAALERTHRSWDARTRLDLLSYGHVSYHLAEPAPDWGHMDFRQRWNTLRPVSCRGTVLGGVTCWGDFIPTGVGGWQAVLPHVKRLNSIAVFTQLAFTLLCAALLIDLGCILLQHSRFRVTAPGRALPERPWSFRLILLLIFVCLLALGGTATGVAELKSLHWPPFNDGLFSCCSGFPSPAPRMLLFSDKWSWLLWIYLAVLVAAAWHLIAARRSWGLIIAALMIYAAIVGWHGFAIWSFTAREFYQKWRFF